MSQPPQRGRGLGGDAGPYGRALWPSSSPVLPAGGEQQVKVRAADLSDQVPDTDSETRILLQGEPTGPDPGRHDPGGGDPVPPNSGGVYYWVSPLHFR